MRYILAQNGSVGIFGVGEADKILFSTEVSQLSLGESALITLGSDKIAEWLLSIYKYE